MEEVVRKLRELMRRPNYFRTFFLYREVNGKRAENRRRKRVFIGKCEDFSGKGCKRLPSQNCGVFAWSRTSVLSGLDGREPRHFG